MNGRARRMIGEVATGLRLLAALTVLTGLVYPLAVTGIAQALFSEKASGSLIERDGRVTGSRLVGQPFDDPRYFWGRLSATSAFPCDAAASAGSNFGPLHPGLETAARNRLAALIAADPENRSSVPVDLLTASASGLDPHISPAAARYQVRRVARARGLDETLVALLVEARVESRDLGVLGEPRVNVLELNLALDHLKARP